MSMESIQEEERIFTPDYEDFIYDPMGFKRGVVIGAKKGLVGWALFDEVDDPYFRYHERLEEIPYYVTMLGEEKCGDLLLPPGVQVMEIPASKGVINQVRDMAISRANDDVDKFFMSQRFTMAYLSNGEACMIKSLDDTGTLDCSSAVGVIELKQLLKSIRKAVLQAWRCVS